VTNLFQLSRVLRGFAVTAAALVGLAALTSAGCFKPKVKDGGLSCNLKLMPDCPEGFKCDDLTNLCRVNSWFDTKPDAAIEDAPDVKLEVEPDRPADMSADMSIEAAPDVPPACLTPVMGCTADPANVKCDPQCQTGCGCHEKCLVTSTGVLTCNQQSGALPRTEGQSCVAVSEGTTAQTDDCEPGLVCFAEPCGHLCARFCRVNADCQGGALCSRALAGGFKACDFPASNCNPVKNAGPTGCPVADEGCYLSATIADRTVCDCPSNSIPNGGACNTSRDCLPGLTCADPLGGLELLCHPACSLTGTTPMEIGCPGTQTCHAFNGSVKFGVCN
jgi:hypothetical protein